MDHSQHRKNPMAVGTAHFESSYAANCYYRQYGNTHEDVRSKIVRGEIAIGRPKKVDGTQYAKCWTDKDGRYWIEA